MARKYWEKPVCGIYKITHRESGKCYVGQSIDVFERWKGHSNLAVKKKSAIQKAFVEYGIDNFSFEVIEECSREDLNDRELHWILHFNSMTPNGYNIAHGGCATFKGIPDKRKRSEEKKKEAVTAPKKVRKKSAPRPKFQCPHCGEQVSSTVLKRHHGDNCKIYKELGVEKIQYLKETFLSASLR